MVLICNSAESSSVKRLPTTAYITLWNAAKLRNWGLVRKKICHCKLFWEWPFPSPTSISVNLRQCEMSDIPYHGMQLTRVCSRKTIWQLIKTSKTMKQNMLSLLSWCHFQIFLVIISLVRYTNHLAFLKMW